jgi:hypothetical protein
MATYFRSIDMFVRFIGRKNKEEVWNTYWLYSKFAFKLAY